MSLTEVLISITVREKIFLLYYCVWSLVTAATGNLYTGSVGQPPGQEAGKEGQGGSGGADTVASTRAKAQWASKS